MVLIPLRGKTIVLALGAVAASAMVLAARQAIQVSESGPDAAAYGQADRYPVGTVDTLDQQRFLVGAYSHMDALFSHRTVAAGGDVWAYERAPDRVIRYRHGTDVRTLDDYMSRAPVTGLLIAKDDTILTERYQYGRTDRDRLTSQSMSKTVVGVLVGLAVTDRRIASIGDRASVYLPDLGDSPYGQTSIRDLLHMSSGVSCPGVDVSPLAPRGTLTAAGLSHCVRTAPAGTVFAYSNLDSQVLGLVVRHVFTADLASVLRDRIWRPMGAEASAEWTLDADGQETAFCCVNAVLRDYARFGRLLAHDGVRGTQALVDRQWLVDATSVSTRDPQLEPGKPAPFLGYGYQVWLLPDSRRMFCLLGSNGQRLFVDPAGGLVMVQTAVGTQEVDRTFDAETIALWLSVVAQFGRLG